MKVIKVPPSSVPNRERPATWVNLSSSFKSCAGFENDFLKRGPLWNVMEGGDLDKRVVSERHPPKHARNVYGREWTARGLSK